MELRYFIRLPQSKIKLPFKLFHIPFLVPHSLSNLLGKNLSFQVIAVVIINVYGVLSVC